MDQAVSESRIASGLAGAALPRQGSVYLADTLVFNNGDHAEARPVVVMRAPRRWMDYVTFLQRTSKCFHLPGVDHPPSPSLGLDRRGKWIFDYQRSVRADEFLAYRFEYRGDLEPEYLRLLLAAWEAQP